MSMVVNNRMHFTGARVSVSLGGSNHTVDFFRPEASQTGVVVALKHDDRPVQTVLVEMNPKGDFVWCITVPSKGNHDLRPLGRGVEVMKLCVANNSLIVTHLDVSESQDGIISDHYFSIDWW